MEQDLLTGSRQGIDINARAARIKVLLMDVDGVMTDGRLFYLVGPDGQMFETKGFNSHDGLGLNLCNVFGIKTGIISGRQSPAVVERARILKMSYVYQGRMAKVGCYEEVLIDAAVEDGQVCFIGDDFTDIPLILRAGLGVAVANARPEVKAAAHLVTAAKGGEGAVREVIDLILKAKNLWDAALKRYERD